MSLADFIIVLVIWIFQKIILPVLRTDMPYFSFATYQGILEGSVKHNLIWGLAGLNNFMNIELVFILVGVIIFAEILFWLVKAGMYLLKLVRG